MSGEVQAAQQQAIGAGGLNAELDHLEILVSKLEPGAGRSVLAILFTMDAIAARMQALKQAGASIKAEESQFETCSAGLRKQAPAFIRAVGGVKALQEERSRWNPSRDDWWWYLDEIYRQKQRSILKKAFLTTLIAAAVIVVLAVVYQNFFAPSPEVLARYNALQESTSLSSEGRYVEALDAVQTGLAVVPDDPELLVMQGVILQAQGYVDQASETFEKARQKIASGQDFFQNRAQDYLSIGKNELALADARSILAADPNSAPGYYFLGSAQEAQNQIGAALDSYQKAVDLAGAQGLTTLTAEIKLKMGYLMQAAGAAMPIVGETPTP